MSSKKRKNNAKDKQQLSVSQTLKYGFKELPDFRRSLLLICLGFIVVLLGGRLVKVDNYLFIVNLVGGGLAFIGFEHLSKIIAALRLVTMEEYNNAMKKKS